MQTTELTECSSAAAIAAPAIILAGKLSLIHILYIYWFFSFCPSKKYQFAMKKTQQNN